MRAVDMLVFVGMSACSSQQTADGGTDAAMDTNADAGCLYTTCTGVAFCALGDSCPVGDGCNVCFCKPEGGGYYAPDSAMPFSCTAHACDCTTCGHAGVACTYASECCSASCEAGACN